MGGFLTGKYSKATPPPADSRFKYNPRLWERASKKSNFEILEQIENVADDVGIPNVEISRIVDTEEPSYNGADRWSLKRGTS